MARVIRQPSQTLRQFYVSCASLAKIARQYWVRFSRSAFIRFAFVVVGRGHDSFEWQAAQISLGLRPAGLQ